MKKADVTTVTTPSRLGGRDQAAQVLEQLPDDLEGEIVQLDFHNALAVTSSFIDEVIKQLVVERSANELRLVGVTDRIRDLAERSAAAHGIEDKVTL